MGVNVDETGRDDLAARAMVSAASAVMLASTAAMRPSRIATSRTAFEPQCGID